MQCSSRLLCSDSENKISPLRHLQHSPMVYSLDFPHQTLPPPLPPQLPLFVLPLPPPLILKTFFF